MQTDIINTKELKEKIEEKTLNRRQCHEVTTLSAELRRLMLKSDNALKEAGIQREMERLEAWLEEQRKGVAPASIISKGGMIWLQELRDRLKLTADEALRLEAEGGNPASDDQIAQTEQLLKTIRRIDRIINDSDTPNTTH